MASIAKFGVIKSGSSAFLMGYRIVFEIEVVLSNSIRADIDALSQYIISYYQEPELQKSISSQATPMQIEHQLSPEKTIGNIFNSDNILATPLQSPLQLERDNGMKKRGRPEITKEEINKRFNRARMNRNYCRSFEKK
jgi:hypothetical protein